MRASRRRTRRALPPTASIRTSCRRAALGVALCVAPAIAMLHAADVAAQASPDAQTAARDHFQRGRIFYDAHRYADAIDEFRQSLEASPSPNARLLVARSLRDMGGHTAEAYAEFMATATDAEERAASEPRYAPVGAAARAEAGLLLAQIALLRIVLTETPEDTDVRLDGREIPREQWNMDLPLEPGSHTLDATAPGRQPFHRVWNVPAGNAVQVAVTLAVEPGQAGTIEVPVLHSGFGPRQQIQPIQPIRPMYNVPMQVRTPVVPHERSGLTTGGGVSIGLGVAVFAAGAISAVLALVTYTNLQNECGDGLCPSTVSNVQSRVDFGRTTGTLGTVGMVGGGALILLGSILYTVGRNQDRQVPEVLVRVFVDPTGVAGVRGTF